ncbi:SEC-C metal-binding domain-containing protein [Tropicimonas sp. IMCC34011]|uniref:SEC-C metal-binding domain-containing protein n=1 Tax=Tropicimonas sp. IMCC34011 TaxID=2248759 RepID=UPI000E2209FC
MAHRGARPVDPRRPSRQPLIETQPLHGLSPKVSRGGRPFRRSACAPYSLPRGAPFAYLFFSKRLRIGLRALSRLRLQGLTLRSSPAGQCRTTHHGRPIPSLCDRCQCRSPCSCGSGRKYKKCCGRN